MQRKLVKQGNNALTVTLPAKWLQEHNLQAGDVIEIEEEENRLVVAGKGALRRNEITLTLSRSMPIHLMKIKLSNAYKKGYDIIQVHFEDHSIFKEIENLTRNLIGFEVVDVADKKCTLRNISVEMESEYELLFKKSFYLLKENMRKIGEDLVTNSFKRGNEVHEYREIITRYADYVKRIFNKNLRFRDTCIFEYLIVRDLEKISNEVDYLYHYLESSSIKSSEKTRAIVTSIFQTVDELFSSYFKKDISYLEMFAKRKDHFMNKELLALLKDPKIDHHVVLRCAKMMRRCQDIVGPFYAVYL
ncbi:AbrB/MazE/SpoVT family DNA-binding domain-containing protein [Candidatus Woesearchaeota archaeon]|nr:AbrB/MazE/SpoVT family DNA-binding domain-containing protein [Candidatus Woesearchaeota archaeon]